MRGSNRIGVLDLYRAIAITVVVIFHFNMDIFPIGYVGVDLFFVISGYLVSKPLLKSYLKGRSVNVRNFLLRRGLKIWPSYYFFLIVAIPLSYLLLYKKDSPQVIPANELIFYLLFLSNYIRGNLHFSFDMNWSLCVEEHFYIILSLSFFLVPFILKKMSWKNRALLIIAVFIGSAILFKLIGYFFRIGEYVHYTENRLDALGLGVLITWIEYFYPEWFKKNSKSFFLFFIGVFILGIVIFLYSKVDEDLYLLLIIHNFAPLSFFLIILGTLGCSINVGPIIRFIALISYNLYLWHSIVAVYIKLNFKDYLFFNWLVYILFSVLISFLVTVTIEYYFMSVRDKLIKITTPQSLRS